MSENKVDIGVLKPISPKEMPKIESSVWNNNENQTCKVQNETIGSSDTPNSKILSFDAYGNLTASNDPKAVYTQDVPSLEEFDQILESFEGGSDKEKLSPSFKRTPKNGLVKRTRRSKPNVEDIGLTDKKKLSEKEINKVFKSDLNSVPTSRYGRNRKKASSDGFVFGTINFNELRKVTSSTNPKKNQSLVDDSPGQDSSDEMYGISNGFMKQEDNFEISDSESQKEETLVKRKSIGRNCKDSNSCKKKPPKTRLSRSTTPKRKSRSKIIKAITDLEEDPISVKEDIKIEKLPISVKEESPNPTVNPCKGILSEENMIFQSKRPTECRKKALLSSLEEDVNIIKSSLQPTQEEEENKIKIEIPEKKMEAESKDADSVTQESLQKTKSKRQVRKTSQAVTSSSPVPLAEPVTQVEEDQSMVEPILDDEEAQKKIPVTYFPGDLVWVYLKGNPMWPSLITCPDLDCSSSKLVAVKNQLLARRLYHVLFLNDGGRTIWVNPSSIVLFEGKQCLMNYLEKLKQTNPKNPHGMVKTLFQKSGGPKYNRWQEAIKEAESNVPLNKTERIQRYNWENRLQSPKVPKKPVSKKKVLKRKRDLKKLSNPFSSLDSDEEGFSGFEDTSSNEERHFKRRKLKETISEGLENFIHKNMPQYLEQNKDVTEQAAKKHLVNVWKNLSYAQKGRYRGKSNSTTSKEFSFDTDYSSDSSSVISKTKRSLDISKGSYKVPRNEKVCQKCYQPGEKDGQDFVKCKGVCNEIFHTACVDLGSLPAKDFKCFPCSSGVRTCFICKETEGKIIRCTIPYCGKFYHMDCARKWPQVYKSKANETKLVCPRHMCHTCAANADDMNDIAAKTPHYTRCIDCPTTYHTGDVCIAAGSDELSAQFHKCTKHLEIPKVNNFHCNISWCFCCSKGGSLLLCDQCPAAFHSECLNITPPEGDYVCEDCENGKFPLYGDIVWVKLGHYRWWPGQVLHPKFIPDNIENLAHKQGMFCVHFFGSDDYFWVSRGRVFLYQEGDQGSKGFTSRVIQTQFRKAMDDVVIAYNEQKTKKAQQELSRSIKGNKKPAPFVKIDTNKPVGNVRLGKLDLSSVTKCDCNPFSDNPCGTDDKCLNRMLMVECIREVCAGGDRCNNQRFQKRQYPNIQHFRTSARGWGLRTNELIRKGQFIIEYVGELVDEPELKRRIMEMHEKNEENYYFLTIDKDHIIDAGPKGNVSRFMNHSCQPNCETQKWTVGADTRVGLFAMEDIEEGSELTFNYNLECVGTEKKKCHCGGENCSGFIGAKVQKSDKNKLDGYKLKKKRRKKKEIKSTEDTCFRCGLDGDLVLCDATSCPKGYHLSCLGLKLLPKGKWICPWHHCDQCGIRAHQRCLYCPNSSCRSHLVGNFHAQPNVNVCVEHNLEDLETRSDVASSNTTSREQSPTEV